MVIHFHGELLRDGLCHMCFVVFFYVSRLWIAGHRHRDYIYTSDWNLMKMHEPVKCETEIVEPLDWTKHNKIITMKMQNFYCLKLSCLYSSP